MAENKQISIDPEKIHLVQIEPMEVFISEVKEPFNQEESIGMEIAHISGYDLDKKDFLLGLDIILTLENRIPEKTARFRYNFHFAIDNLEQMYNINEKDEPSFHKQFAATLAGISYSTLRGIMFEKLFHSSWGSTIVPVINPAKILERWIDPE